MVDKKNAFVKNKFHENRVKRFFAICKDLGLNGIQQKEYYKNLLDVEHIDDINDEQWDFIFEDLAVRIEAKSIREGTIFTRDLDATIREILGD